MDAGADTHAQTRIQRLTFLPQYGQKSPVLRSRYLPQWGHLRQIHRKTMLPHSTNTPAAVNGFSSAIAPISPITAPIAKMIPDAAWVVTCASSPPRETLYFLYYKREWLGNKGQKLPLLKRTIEAKNGMKGNALNANAFFGTATCETGATSKLYESHRSWQSALGKESHESVAAVGCVTYMPEVP